MRAENLEIKMQTIDDLWKKLKDVELVQVRPVEMEAIYKHCFEFEKPLIVEVGSAHGASSIILAEAAEELDGLLFCIDPFPEDYLGQEKFGDYARKQFKKNIKPYGSTVWHLDMGSSQAASKFMDNSSKIDVLFIDADHSYEGVARDCQMLLSYLRSGGYVAFHDYNNQGAFPGVKQAADEACSGWEKTDDAWDLVIFRKP